MYWYATRTNELFENSSASDFGLAQTVAWDLHALARAGIKVFAANERTQEHRPIDQRAHAVLFRAGATARRMLPDILPSSEDLAIQR